VSGPRSERAGERVVEVGPDADVLARLRAMKGRHIDTLIARDAPAFWSEPGETLAAAAAALAPGGELHLLHSAGAWARGCGAPELAVELAGVLRRHGFAVEEPEVKQLGSGPLLRLVARPRAD
jgi:hypothetical protein